MMPSDLVVINNNNILIIILADDEAQGWKSWRATCSEQQDKMSQYYSKSICKP